MYSRNKKRIKEEQKTITITTTTKKKNVKDNEKGG